ncbi:MAG: murein biosynthesis integral membrane protein MurJ [Myxococcota bacterium]|nr:murein biosynthesis integral membrane protein MurJ [Myxococcota bacterium]
MVDISGFRQCLEHLRDRMASSPLPAIGMPPPPKLRKAAFVTSIASMLVRLSGFVRDIIFSTIFGAGAAADAFYAALRAPNLFRELFAEGTLSNIVVPLFAEHNEQKGKEAAFALINALMGVLLCILSIITLILLFFPTTFVTLIASGFDSTPNKFELTAVLIQWLSPFLMGLSVASLFSGMLNVKGKFFLPALAPGVFNLAIIVACLVSDSFESQFGHPKIVLIAISASLSGFLSAVIQYPSLREMGYRFRPSLKGHPALKRAFKFGLAAVVGVCVVQFNLLVETQLASRLGDGPVSHLTLSFRFIQIPQGIVASSIAIALLAQLSNVLASHDKVTAKNEIQRAIHLNNTLVFPAAVGLFVFAEPLVALTFEHGKFTALDTASTAHSLKGYAIAAIGICLYRILLPVFFALKDPYTPMKWAIVIAILKLPVAYALLETLGLIGLPLSHAVTVSVEVTAMLWILNKRFHILDISFLKETVKIALATTIMALILLPLKPYSDGLLLFIHVAIGALVFGVFGLVFKVEAVSSLFQKISRKRLPPPPSDHD